MLPSQRLDEFNRLFKTYFASVSQHLVKEHKAMHKRERRNHHLLTSKGEIPEERQAENEAAQKAYDKLLTSVSTLAVSSVCELLCRERERDEEERERRLLSLICM